MVGLQVLVVDDAAPVRDLLVNYFVARHMVVTAVGDGAAAIKLLERSPGRFGLVITDLNLPGADGFAVLMESRRWNPHCPVVMITGYATMDSAIQAVRVGAYDYLPKPFTVAEVDALIGRIAEDLKWIVETGPPPVQSQPSTALVDLASLARRLEVLERRVTLLERDPLMELIDGEPTPR